jgi:hypothetical protein
MVEPLLLPLVEPLELPPLVDPELPPLLDVLPLVLPPLVLPLLVPLPVLPVPLLPPELLVPEPLLLVEPLPLVEPPLVDPLVELVPPSPPDELESPLHAAFSASAATAASPRTEKREEVFRMRASFPRSGVSHKAHPRLCRPISKRTVRAVTLAV